MQPLVGIQHRGKPLLITYMPFELTGESRNPSAFEEEAHGLDFRTPVHDLYNFKGQRPTYTSSWRKAT